MCARCAALPNVGKCSDKILDVSRFSNTNSKVWGQPHRLLCGLDALLQEPSLGGEVLLPDGVLVLLASGGRQLRAEALHPLGVLLLARYLLAHLSHQLRHLFDILVHLSADSTRMLSRFRFGPTR